MPYINVKVSVKLTDERKAEISKAVAECVTAIPGKTYANTMIQIDGGAFIHKGDCAECAFIDARLKGVAPQEARNEFVKTLTARIQELTGIQPDQQYYNIIELQGWGSRGQYSE